MHPTVKPLSRVNGKRFTVPFVAAVLLDAGLVSKEQHDLIVQKRESPKETLRKRYSSMRGKSGVSPVIQESPIEVITSLNIRSPGLNGKILTEDRITEAVAEAVGMEYRKIDPLKLELETVTSYVPKPFAQRHLIVPITEENQTVIMAVADPFDVEPIQSLQRAKRIRIKTVLSSKTDIRKVVQEFYGFRASVTAAEAEINAPTDLGNLEQFVALKGQGEIEATDQHVVNAVEYLLHYAFDQRASDIHIEPKRDSSTVRLRIDGVLHFIYAIPKSVHPAVVSRIKMLSRMDIAEKRRPQDGRIKIQQGGKESELRVSTLPTAFGEKVVIRILDPEVLLQSLRHLGFYQREYQLYSRFIRRPNGIILVTGPTGSGKTTTLYSTLKKIATPEKNIVTIEDPIEMVMEEFNQVGVQPALGVTFSTILRTILRQDPDIIMVGEIRDRETAENAVQSALTGHLVLSTLHTNDAPSSITRLLDLGVPSFLLASTLIGIIAQRLVRKICPVCKRERKITEEERGFLQLPDDFPPVVRYGEGCNECRKTGFKGRTGIFEVMDMTDNVRDILSDRINLSELYAAARRDGMVPLKTVAIEKMREGVTTYEEIVAVTGFGH